MMFTNNVNHKQNVATSLVKEIVESINSVKPFGSVEIYIQNGEVTQITMRKIRKTNGVAKAKKAK